MKVGYKKSLSTIYILLGVVGLCFVLFTGILAGDISVPLTSAAFALIFLGVLFRSRPYFEINENRLTLFALVGRSIKTYNVSDIEVEGEIIYFNQQGKRLKLGLAPWMIERDDWKELINKFQRKNTE